MYRQIIHGLWTAVVCSLIGMASAEAVVKTGTPRVGHVGLQFLSIGQGARAAAMGYAFTAVADDISTVFWNVGGLTQVENFAYTFTYTRWFVDSRVYSAALAKTTNFGTVAFSMIGFAPKAFEETTTLSAQGTGRMVKAGDIAIGLAYARRLTDKFSFGFQFRYLREDLFLDKLSTFDIDLGTTFHTGFKSMRLSMSMRNLGPDAQVIASRYQIPLEFTLGGAMETYGQQGDPAYMTVAFDYLYNIEREDKYHLGAEIWISNTLALRGGYRFKYYSDRGVTARFGLKHRFSERGGVEVGVAYAPPPPIFEAPLRFTVGGTF